MAFSPDFRAAPGTVGRADAATFLDAGLRSYMLRVYNWMTSGLMLSGIIAYRVINVPAVYDVFYPLVETPRGLMHVPGGLVWISIFAPLAFVMVLSFGVNKLSTTAAQALYWAFAAVMGVSLSNVLRMYTGTSVAQVFFITSGTFAAMSLYGYTTRSDLTKMGSFMMMGLFGVIIASLVNMFVGSSALQFGISVIGVLVFVGLTAYDTQRIKNDFVTTTSAYGPEMAAKRSVYDALQLFLNFINLFMLLLNLMGNRSSNN